MFLNFFHSNKPGEQFESLLAPHMDNLYRLAYRFTGQRHDAEDLVQELLLKLYPKHSQLQEIEQLRPWLARTLYNLYIDTIRRQQRSALGNIDFDSEAELEALIDHAPEPEKRLELDDTGNRIAAALEQLKEPQRALIILHDMEGYTLAELAEILPHPIGTLKSRLHRARRQLRDLLSTEPFASERRFSG